MSGEQPMCKWCSQRHPEEWNCGWKPPVEPVTENGYYSPEFKTRAGIYTEDLAILVRIALRHDEIHLHQAANFLGLTISDMRALADWWASKEPKKKVPEDSKPLRCPEEDIITNAQCLLLEGHKGRHAFRNGTASVWESVGKKSK